MLLKDLKQQKLLAHKGRCFDIRYSQDNKFLLSASEDGTAILWDVKLRKVRSTLKHNKESEVLRAAFLNVTSTLIATCGADGRAIIWKSSKCDSTGIHSNASILKQASISKGDEIAEGIANSNNEIDNNRMKKEAILPHGQAQIYACEGMDVNDGASCFFMTAADSSVYLWDVNSCSDNKSSSSSSTPAHVWTVDSNSSNNSSPVNTPGDNQGGNAYGGPRNPDNQVYIFDAKVNPAQGNVIGLALSDGNIRQIDIRTSIFATTNTINGSPTYMGTSSRNRFFGEDSTGPILSSISLSGLSTSPSKKARVGNSHATSVCYSDDGLTLLAALGSGDVAVLDLRMGLVRTLLHSHTRTCYGASFNKPLPIRATAAGTDTKKTSSEPIDREKSAKFSTHESEDDDSKNSHKRNLDFSGDKESEDPSSESVISSSSSQCITWSSDCTVRSWDISVDGLCTEPIDTVEIPDFPIFCCASKGGGESREFVCGGGNGDVSFIGTPLHFFTDFDS